MKRLFLLIKKKRSSKNQECATHLSLEGFHQPMCLYLTCKSSSELRGPNEIFSERLLSTASSFCSVTDILWSEILYLFDQAWTEKNPAFLQYQLLLNGKSIWKLKMRNVALSLFKLQPIFTAVNVLTLCRCK